MKVFLVFLIIYMLLRLTDEHLPKNENSRKLYNRTIEHRSHRKDNNDKSNCSLGYSEENHTPDKHSLTKCQKYLKLAQMKPSIQPLAMYVVNNTEPLPNVQGHNDRYFYMAGEDEKVYLVDAEEAPYMNEVIQCYYSQIKYYLYTSDNRDYPQHLPYDIQYIRERTNFFNYRVTVFLCHGWLGHYAVASMRTLIHAFLNNDSVNVIVIDWSELGSTFYPTAKNSVHMVGRKVGDFITWMVNHYLIEYNKIHLVGFGLGAHVVGNAGRHTGAKVERITGLDPAGPLWYYDSNRLAYTDAQYVEVIHTNTHLFGWLSGWALGYSEPCGHKDFYPNGGRIMPGCWFNTCSHNKAYEYMAASLEYDKFQTRKCYSYWEAANDYCGGEIVLMGNNVLKKPGKPGMYRGNTRNSFPFY